MRSLAEYAGMVNRRLEELIEEVPEGRLEIDRMPWLLSESMRYSLCAGGKRLRPSMMLAAVEMLDGPLEESLDFACAVEMIHTYSLIHDDLPGMDNDSLRRGRPTSHVVFGEGQAILAGDALLNYAFEVMLNRACSWPERAGECLRAMSDIARGAGVTGMIAGQAMDLHCERQGIQDADALAYIHYGKTSCMFGYPLRAAVHLSRGDDSALLALAKYGHDFGILFQATDDLLDVEGDADSLGKTPGKDAACGKLTCVSCYGIERTRFEIAKLCVSAHAALAPFGDRAAFFHDLLDSMVNRNK